MTKRAVTGTDIGKQVVYDHEAYVLCMLETKYEHGRTTATAEISTRGYSGVRLKVPTDQVFVVEPSEKDCTRCKVYASEYVDGEHGCSYCPTGVDLIRGSLAKEERLHSKYKELLQNVEKHNDALEKGIKEQVAEVNRLREIVKLQGPQQRWKGCTAAEAREHYAAGRKVCNPNWPGYVQNNKIFGLSGDLGQWLGYLAMGSGPWLFGVEPC